MKQPLSSSHIRSLRVTVYKEKKIFLNKEVFIFIRKRDENRHKLIFKKICFELLNENKNAQERAFIESSDKE